MFYNDFEMVSKPKILNSVDKNMNTDNLHYVNELNKLISFDREDEEIINSNLRNSIDNSSNLNSNNKSKINLTGITDVLGGSFNANLSLNESDSNIDTKNYKKIRKRIKKILKIIKEHLNNRDHPILITMNIFVEELSKFITGKIEEIKSKNNYKNIVKELNIEIVKIIQKFIINCQTCVKLFYDETVDLQCFLEEKDEMINLISSVLFKSGNLYKKICDLFLLEIEDEIIDLKIRLNYLKDMKINDISIPPKFALDESTEKLKNDLIKKYEESHQKKFKPKIEQNNNNNIEKNPFISKSYNKNKKIKGYDTAIQLIQNLNLNEIPFEKMMLIASISTEIIDCINEYWKGMEVVEQSVEN